MRVPDFVDFQKMEFAKLKHAHIGWKE